jgi:hypothetical protein
MVIDELSAVSRDRVNVARRQLKRRLMLDTSRGATGNIARGVEGKDVHVQIRS